EGTADILESCELSCGVCVALPPPPPHAPPLGSEECADDEAFRDEKAYPCSTWEGYNCSDAVGWGYTEEGTADILESCELSCGVCVALPPPPPHAPPLGSEECADDEAFRDEKAYPCSTWEGYNCSDAVSWGYTEEGTADILESCELSCGVCVALPPPPPHAPPLGSEECADDEAFRDEKTYPCSTWSDFDCTAAVTQFGYTEEGAADILQRCELSCGLCANPPFPDACFNDVFFKDELGNDCITWESYNCSDAVNLGYTEEGTADILENCERSCGLCVTPPPPPPHSPEYANVSSCITYTSLVSGTCESNGMRPVLDEVECEVASLEAGFTDSTASRDYGDPNYPIGCYIYSWYGVDRLWINQEVSFVTYSNCATYARCICACFLPPPPPSSPPTNMLLINGTATIWNSSEAADQMNQAVSMQDISIIYLESDVKITSTYTIAHTLEIIGQCNTQRPTQPIAWYLAELCWVFAPALPHFLEGKGPDSWGQDQQLICKAVELFWPGECARFGGLVGEGASEEKPGGGSGKERAGQQAGTAVCSLGSRVLNGSREEHSSPEGAFVAKPPRRIRVFAVSSEANAMP
ncbi:hypothetical protein CYMTET_54104, partial [Cymbomonas tetramitiformis]